jgi:transposase
VVVDGLSVTETINDVQNIVDKEPWTDPVKNKIKDLILIASIMKDRLSTNSQNSSQPPSQDEQQDKDPKDKPKPPGSRKPGGQKGHVGNQLKPVENPDEIIDLPVDRSQLPEGSYTALGYESRQVIDLKISRHVIEYRAEIVSNGSGGVYRANFPKEATRPVQYGAYLKAYAIYISQFQLIPYDRVTQQINDTTAISLSVGSVYNFINEAYQLLQPFKHWLIESQSNSMVLNADETGINVGGKNHWLHSLSNSQSTYFHADKKRGSSAMDAMEVLPQFTGVLCHDHWKPYYKYKCVHALCNAHHLRELTRAYEQDNQLWAKEVYDLLIEMNKASKASSDGVLSKTEIEVYEKKYLDLLESGKKECPEIIVSRGNAKKGKVKRTRARNLLNRLIKYIDDALRFTKESNVPFTNNNAEREIRMTKVHQKVSGCFRSMKGAEMFCLNRSYLMTCRKHGIKAMDALVILFKGELPDFMNSS